MIKNKKLLIIIAILLIVLIGATIAAILIIKPSDNTNSSSSDTKKISVIASNKDDVKSISISNPKGDYTLLQNEPGKYLIQNSENAKLIDSETKALFEVLSNIDATKDIGVVENINEFGLDIAIATAVLTYGDGTTTTIKIGKTLSNGDYYCMTDKSSNVYSVASSIATHLLTNKMSYFSTSLLKTTITTDTLKSFSIVKGSETKLTIVKNQAPVESSEYFTLTTQFQILEPFNWGADDNIIVGSEEDKNGIISYLSLLSMKEVVDDNVQIDTLKKYGLTEPAYTLKLYDTQNMIVYLSEKQSDNTFYAYSDSSTVVGKVDARVLSFLEKDANYFCSKMTSLIDIKLVNSLSIKTTDKTYKFDLLNSDKKGDEMKVIYEGNELNTEEFRHLYTVAISANITGLGEKPNSAPFLTVEIDLKDGSKNIVNYYQYENSLECFAEINGKDKFTVFKSSVDRIISSTKDYINGKKVVVEN